ncbi:endonuclease-reverse transcriptase [Plakobranchus ocellatus]|uniref:Endonuclease-reverse transcriptase n=1 Tax=Plakobranchus ocellatus TaxID=259542 RepID=A0AAV4DJI8_9GAST|nr:endonuclease-reverse transcriptase [Plakobranchus ocellatus]
MERYGIVVGGRKISNLGYADDTAICANNQTEATTLMNELNDAGERKSLKLNAKKTKSMHIGKEQHASITIGNKEIECVEHFKYLGSIKTDTADCSIDVNTRIGMAKKRMIDLNNIWKDKHIGKQLKIKLVKCLVWTVMTYGAEGWTLRKRDEKKINSAEMWFCRRPLRVSWKEKRTDEAILAELQVRRHLLESIRKRKLSFFGHICRSKCTLMKDIIQGKLEGKRGRGRPRAAYLDNIKTWTRRNSTEIYTMTERREEWRKLVQKAVRAANASRSDAG